MVSDLNSIIFGFSRAMYSTWFYYKPDNLLLDAGEGVATNLGNRVFAIERILLSHGHIDHISGLPVLIHARNAAMGDVEKPLEIYYPEGDSLVESLRAYLRLMSRSLKFELRWLPLGSGASFPATDVSSHSRFIETFSTCHSRNRLTLGYNIVETRRRLRSEFRDLPQAVIQERVKTAGRDAVSEEYQQKLISYCGDCTPINPALVYGTDLLMHEATLIEPEDVKFPVHSTLEDAIRAAIDADAKALLVFHVSSRYRSNEINSAAETLSAKLGFDRPFWIQHFNRLWKVE